VRAHLTQLGQLVTRQLAVSVGVELEQALAEVLRQFVLGEHSVAVLVALGEALGGVLPVRRLLFGVAERAVLVAVGLVEVRSDAAQHLVPRDLAVGVLVELFEVVHPALATTTLVFRLVGLCGGDGHPREGGENGDDDGFLHDVPFLVAGERTQRPVRIFERTP
jgi:hypothetical protein